MTDKALPPPPYGNGEKNIYSNGSDLKPPLIDAPAPSSSATTTAVPHRPEIKVPSSGSFTRLSLQTKWANITGTYYINAVNPAPPNLQSRRKRRKQKKTREIPDAVFRTRRGNLTLDLCTNGYAKDVPRASIRASSRSGNISLNLIAGGAAKPKFDLECGSRSGTIVLFVPETYSGVIQLHTKSGTMNFLPGISSEMNVVKSSDTECMVYVRSRLMAPNQPADFCRVRTRGGDIIVGERGKDTYHKPKTLLEKLTGFLSV
ncbi:hypothetical protein FB45DRAFT_1031160 [Roridomyces roridus]|uniref:DUF7330 domain-containing protein n=1 Tax=Roridomyces roridus TaxID=1738132 RepID=A0AAD7BJV6_9AGAR|nr:hypothetical protein FB45DRAFT_1031160 [Roridomyces roridus]